MITYAIDGVPLDDPNSRWRLLKTTTVGPGLSVRAVDVAIPGMDGNLPAGLEALDAPSQLFRMGVYGRDTAELMLNYGALLPLFTSGVTVTKTVGGVDRSIAAAGKSTTTPEYFPAGPRLQFTAEMRLPGVFWRGQSATWTVVAPASGTTYPVTTLDGSTAPVDDALVLIDGPVVNPKLTCGTGWFRLGLTLAAGESALVDCRAWTVRAGSGVTFAGGGTVKTGVLSTSGGPYLLRLRPAMVGTDPTVTQVSVALSFDAGTPSLSVQASPAFLA